MSFTARTEPGVQAGHTDVLSQCRAMIAAALLVVACSPSRPTPSGIPPAPTVPAPAPAPMAPPPPTRWRISTPALPATFVIDSRAVVSARADTLARTDTLDVHATLTAIQRGAAIDVSVASYSVRPSSGTERALPGTVRAIARFDTYGGVTFEGGGLANCALMSGAAIESTRDLWVRWPAQPLTNGDKWRDSVRATVCRDGVPLQITVVRDYTLTEAGGADSALLMTVSRRSTIGIRGTGVIRGDTTTVTGDGVATATMHLSATMGWIQDIAAESRVTLMARGKTRTQAVDQTVRQTIRRTDPPSR